MSIKVSSVDSIEVNIISDIITYIINADSRYIVRFRGTIVRFNYYLTIDRHGCRVFSNTFQVNHVKYVDKGYIVSGINNNGLVEIRYNDERHAKFYSFLWAYDIYKEAKIKLQCSILGKNQEKIDKYGERTFTISL